LRNAPITKTFENCMYRNYLDVLFVWRFNLLQKYCCLCEDGAEEVVWYIILNIELKGYDFVEQQRGIIDSLEVDFQK
jgi:hypothetical protein